jgi:hypothetical protein
MSLTGMRRALLTSPLSRVVTLAAALLLAFVCVADLAHAAGSAADGCPEGKLESQRPPVISVDSAVLPDRIESPRPSIVGRVRDTGPVVTTSFVLTRPAAPRAPPTA